MSSLSHAPDVNLYKLFYQTRIFTCWIYGVSTADLGASPPISGTVEPQTAQ